VDQVRALVDDALREAADPTFLTSAIVEKAIRVARLRKDGRNLLWLLNETMTFGDGLERDRRADSLRPFFPNEAIFKEAWAAEGEAFVQRRTLNPLQADSPMTGMSIREIELQADNLVALSAALSDGSDSQLQGLHRAAELRNVVARVRTRVVDYLGSVEAQLYFDDRVSDVFETHRAYVDARLQAAAPQAFEQLRAAYSRRAADDAEARSHALTSCRRALKSLADVLYPATSQSVVGADGVAREMTDDKFLNRLLQFVGDHAEGLGSAERSLVRSQIPMLGAKLSALSDLASKGVHDSTTDAEVDHCILETYLTIGDLLRLADKESVSP
jgi:hypothetical protein